MTAREKFMCRVVLINSMKNLKFGGHEMEMLEIKNIYTDKVYYVKKSDVNNSIIELHNINHNRLTQVKTVGNATLKADYKITAALEIV